MDASAGAAGAAATAAATVADFESELRGLIASTLRSGSSVFETLRTLLSALASVPTDVNMDDDNTFLLEEREMNAATILASIQRWVVGLDQRMQLAHPIVRQSQPSRSPTISSDNTADDGGSTLASHFWLPDGSRNTPTDPTRFVEALRANAADLMLAAESVVERAPSPAHIDFLLRIIPLALPIPSPPGTQSRRISHNTVRSDFLLPFHGRLVELLERYILNANKYMRSHSTHVYAKCFPILQSSGTGKSKLAVQLSAYQAGMMVCTRSPHTQSVRDHVSFPPNDDSVYDFLSHREELDSFPHHKRIACWLGAYFAVLAYSLEKRLVASGCFNGLEEPPRAPTGYNMPPSSSSAPSSSTLPPADAATATAVSDLDPNDSPARTSSITCKHDHPNLCWQTVVFHLALAIHDGPDFVSNYRFEQSGQRHDERRCPDSCLNFTAYNDPDTSFPEPTPVSNPSSIDSDMQRSRTLPVPDGAPLPYVPPPAARPSLPTRHPRFRSYLLGKIAQIAKENFKKEDPGPQPADKEESLPIEKIAEYASDGYMRPYLRRLERLLPGPLHNSHFFFLVIDEVIPIRHCLPVLRRLWAEAKPRFSWLMFTDTDSKVAPRASPHIRLASARLDVKQQLMVIPPFCKLGFDAAIQHDLESLRKPLLSGQLTFGHLLDKLSSFRRPLWSTSLYRSANAPRRPNLANILLKLLNQERWPAVWPDPGPTGKDFADPNSPFFKGIMAIAGQRLPLRFIGHQGVQLYSGNESTESSSAFVGTSGEALQQSGSINFLQNQASHHLRVISKRWSTIIKALVHAHRAVGLMLGGEGEEGVRLLLSMAADLVASKRIQLLNANAAQDTKDEPSVFAAQCDPICLCDWLETLFGKNLDYNLRKWASKYFLNFTHYLRLSSYVYSDPDKQHRRLQCSALVEYWMRQVAFYGLDNQHGWDVVIPIYRSDRPPANSDTFQPANLSYVAIQVKNCKCDIKATRFFGPALRSSSSSSSEGNGGNGGLDSSILENKFLEIFLDLRSPTPMHRFEWLSASSDEMKCPPTNRLHLTVGGCDARTFPLIGGLTSEASCLLELLFGHTESDMSLDKGRIELDKAIHGESPEKEEFERLQQIIDGEGPAYLWESHRGSTKRGATGIPWANRKRQFAPPNDDGDDDVVMALPQAE